MEDSKRESYLLNIKRKLIVLYLLNFSDGIFTQELIRTGSFREVNPILSPFVGSAVFYIIKLLLPICVLTLFYWRIKNHEGTELPFVTACIPVLMYIYLFINLYHIYNLLTFFLSPGI